MCSFNEDDKERPPDKDDQTLDTVVVYFVFRSLCLESKSLYCVPNSVIFYLTYFSPNHILDAYKNKRAHKNPTCTNRHINLCKSGEFSFILRFFVTNQTTSP